MAGICFAINSRTVIGAGLDGCCDDGAGAPAGGVALSVAVIVVPAGAPAPNISVADALPNVGSTTLPPPAGIAWVLVPFGVPVGDGVGIGGGVVTALLLEQLAASPAASTTRAAPADRAERAIERHIT